jgi:hypothetical protein
MLAVWLAGAGARPRQEEFATSALATLSPSPRSSAIPSSSKLVAPAHTEAALGAPPEQHVGDDPVCAGDLRNRRTRPLGFEHDRALLGVGEAAALLACGWARIRRRRRCQDVFDRRSLSAIVSTSAHSWTGTRMKMRPPVDLHLAVVEPVAPLAQTLRRKKQRGCVVAPLQFKASTCIAQNAWTARERVSVRTPKRRRGGVLPPLFPADSRRCSARLRVSSVLMRCFIQRSNLFFDNPC